LSSFIYYLKSNTLKTYQTALEHSYEWVTFDADVTQKNTCTENSKSPTSKIFACRKEAGKRFSKPFHKSNSMDDLKKGRKTAYTNTNNYINVRSKADK